MGMRSLAQDFGDTVRSRVFTDSSASKGIASRVGLGTVRHLDVALLWLHHHVNKRTLEIRKVPGKQNIADIGTKDLAHEVIARHMNTMGFVELKRKHAKALQVWERQPILNHWNAGRWVE